MINGWSDIQQFFSYPCEANQVVESILDCAPESVDSIRQNKIYFDTGKTYQICDQWFLETDYYGDLFLPGAVHDDEGVSISLANNPHDVKPKRKKKLFKLVCNSCLHEWEGGVFTIRCPKCRSKDFSIVPNW